MGHDGVCRDSEAFVVLIANKLALMQLTLWPVLYQRLYAPSNASASTSACASVTFQAPNLEACPRTEDTSGGRRGQSSGPNDRVYFFPLPLPHQ